MIGEVGITMTMTLTRMMMMMITGCCRCRFWWERLSALSASFVPACFSSVLIVDVVGLVVGSRVVKTIARLPARLPVRPPAFVRRPGGRPAGLDVVRHRAVAHREEKAWSDIQKPTLLLLLL